MYYPLAVYSHPNNELDLSAEVEMSFLAKLNRNCFAWPILAV